MSYNEYAQVLEPKNPKTGELYKPSDCKAADRHPEPRRRLTRPTR